ncbi:MAG: D-Ala-D-Ala carboxypeptidase family metallohydrolase [Cyanobacteriota bacterium]
MDVPLFTLEAVQDTWLKKAPVQADSLAKDRKVAVRAGSRYGVLAQRELPADGHASVDLAAGAGSWDLWAAHWRRPDGSTEAHSAPTSTVPQANIQPPAAGQAVNWGDFNQLIHPYLSVGEVVQWDIRRRPGVGSADEKRLLATAEQHRLIREAWGSALGVTSFYRPEPINSQVGGVSGSRHITGEAMDVYPVGRDLEDFYQWIRHRWSGGLGDGRNKGFIHLDTRNGGSFQASAKATPAAEWLY